MVLGENLQFAEHAIKPTVGLGGSCTLETEAGWP